MVSGSEKDFSKERIYILCQDLSNKDGRFYGEENPPKKDSKGKGLVGRRGTWQAQRRQRKPGSLDLSERGEGEDKAELDPQDLETHFHVFGLSLKSSEEALKGFKLASDVIRFMFWGHCLGGYVEDGSGGKMAAGSLSKGLS